MRFLAARTFQFKEFSDRRLFPPYAILSHTWSENEVEYAELKSAFQHACQRPEFAKVRFTAQQAIDDGLEYIWVDACCIDKSSSAELSESINSMFMLYKNAQVCYFYLADVTEPPPPGWADDGDEENDWTKKFVSAKWFTRGWTLQEMIAPRSGVFYTSDWRRIGTKRELCQTIARHTGVSSPILIGADFSRTLVAERMSWAAKRETRRVEDIAYCLLGLFDINMPLLYGEGERAFLRLQHEIIKKTNDRSIFLWTAREKSHTTFRNLFARSPAEFASFDDYNLDTTYGRFEVTQKGLEIGLPLMEVPGAPQTEFFAAIIDAGRGFHCVQLRRIGQETYARVDADEIFRIENPEYNPFASDNPSPDQVWITVPNTFDNFNYDAHVDYRLGGFQVEHHPLELRILRVEPSDAWDEETRTLQLDFSKSFKPIEDDALKIVFCEVSNPDKTYEVDLLDKMRNPSTWTTWNTDENDRIGYVDRIRKRFVGDKMLNVLNVEYQIKVADGFIISTEKKPLPSRYISYRTLTDDERVVFFATMDKERERNNGNSAGRITEEQDDDSADRATDPESGQEKDDAPEGAMEESRPSPVDDLSDAGDLPRFDHVSDSNRSPDPEDLPDEDDLSIPDDIRSSDVDGIFAGEEAAKQPAP